LLREHATPTYITDEPRQAKTVLKLHSVLLAVVVLQKGAIHLLPNIIVTSSALRTICCIMGFVQPSFPLVNHANSSSYSYY
jgi:hypothetical protein